ncbi:MAG: nucleotidyltransferase family protein [Rhodocyclaceae bacterium]
MKALEQLNRHRDNLLALASRHHATRIRIFGSVARGEDKPDSDIDLLVDFAPEASLLDLVGLQQDAEALLGRQVDVVTPEGVSPFLRERILAGARPL